MSNWFESWFDTPYYHLLYKNRDDDEARKFVQELVQKLDIRKDAYILDLCCGKGRHAIRLNELGYKVHGIDLSSKSIEHAKSFENSRLSFEIKDMRDKIENGPFDVVFNLFTSFGYFDNESENEKVLNAIRKYLKSDGILIIDFLNAITITKSLPQDEEIVLENITFNVRKVFQDKTIKKEIKFTDAEMDYSFSEEVRAFRLEDFKRMFENTGFELIGVYGDYDLSEFIEEKSPRLILKAKLK